MLVLSSRSVEELLSRSCNTEMAATAFDSTVVPEISLRDYLDRLKRALFMTDAQVWLAVHYIDRYLKASGPTVSFSSMHRLLGTSAVLAQKFDSDVAFPERAYAKAVGVTVRELMGLQMLFMRSIDFRLMYPSPEEEVTATQALKLGAPLRSALEASQEV